MNCLRRHILFGAITALACILSSCGERINPTWTPWVPASNQQLRSVQFLDQQTGFAAGGVRFSEALLIGTKDGGQDWQNHPTGIGQIIFDLEFQNELQGFACGMGGKILRTQNGGESWKVTQLPLWDPAHSITQVKDSLLFSVGGNGYDEGFIVCSKNYGQSWSVVDTFDREMRDVVFVDRDHGFIAAYGAIYRSMDGGLSWEFTEAEGDFFSALSFPTPQVGYAVGRSGGIYKTTDGGSSWDRQRNGNAVLQARHYYNDVVFLTTEVGYIVGDNGLVRKTSDGGKKWQNFEKNEQVDLYSISMIREGLGFVSGAAGYLIRFEE